MAAMAGRLPVKEAAAAAVGGGGGMDHLPSHYFSGVFVILSTASLPLIQCTKAFYTNFHRLPSILKSYSMLLVWDWYLVLNYLARDLWNVHKGFLDDGLWCRAHGFTNVAGTLALRISSAVTAYAVYRMAKGKTLSDKTLWRSYAFSWFAGISLASIFVLHDAYGPYKKLYCCVKETAYYPSATIPCFITTFSSIFAVLYFYYQAQKEVKKEENKSSLTPQIETIVQRGLIHGLSFYVLWALVISAGVVTSMGGNVPVLVDLAAAWVVKLEATIDSYLLMNTIEMVLHPKGKQA